jgi:DNA-binding GntR family transcriptional regulator
MKLTQRENAYRQIRQKLVEGGLRPGVRLSPTALAREIGISHIPIREAITQLQSEGLVVHVAHRGSFVKGMDRQELVDTMEIRMVLECHAAAKAARRISSDQLQELQRNWARLCELARAFDVPPGTNLRDLLAEWLLADLAFHMSIFKAAGNARAIRVLQDTRSLTQMFGRRTDHPAAWANPRGFADENLRVHEHVYQAICRHDPKAARRAMAVHMRVARKNVLARYDWLHRQGNVQESFAEEFPDSMRDAVRDIQQDALPEAAQRDSSSTDH